VAPWQVDGASRVQTCLSNKAKAQPRSMSAPCMRELERVWFSLELANQLLSAIGPHAVVGVKDAALRWFAWATVDNIFWVFKAAMVCAMAAFFYVTVLMCFKYRYVLDAFLGGSVGKALTRTFAPPGRDRSA
jgi:hypothetical protein